MNITKQSWSVRIGGQKVKVKEGSLDLELNANGVSILAFVAETKTADRKIYKDGAYVEFIYQELGQESVTAFGGVISKSDLRDIPHTGIRYHKITAQDNSYFANKRVIAKAYVDYENKIYIGDIVTDIFSNYLEAEGITVGNIEQGTQVDAMSFNYVPVTEALNRLADRSGFVWYIDEHRRLYFQERTANSADFIFSDAVIQEGTFRLTSSKKDYRNQQIIKGATSTTSLQVEEFKLYNNTENEDIISFPLGYRLAHKPVVNYGLSTADNLVDPALVVVKGSADESSAWVLYQEGSEVITITNLGRQNMITQADDVVAFKYRGRYPIVISIPAPDEITRKKLIEGGTGVVENVVIDNSIKDILQAVDTANSYLTKYSKDNYIITFDTDAYHVKAGDIVSVDFPNEIDVEESSDFVVESIRVVDEFEYLWFTYKLVKGHAHKSWLDVLKKGLTQGALTDEEDVVEQEMVVLTAPDSEQSWDYLDAGNPLRKLKAGGTREDTGEALVADTVFQCTDNDVLRVMKAIDVDYIEEGTTDTYTVRVGRASEVDKLATDKSLTSIFQIPTFLANGTITAIRFYGGADAKTTQESVGTGKLYGTLNDLSIEKNDLTIINVYRIDNKNW